MQTAQSADDGRDVAARFLLRRWRTEREEPLGMKEAGAILGVSYSHLANIEAGRELPSLTLATRIEKVVGVPAGAWVEEPAPVPALAASEGSERG